MLGTQLSHTSDAREHYFDRRILDKLTVNEHCDKNNTFALLFANKVIFFSWPEPSVFRVQAIVS